MESANDVPEKGFLTISKVTGEISGAGAANSIAMMNWRDMLAEARAIFPATTFPGHWVLPA